jgi:hypothetical protein
MARLLLGDFERAWPDYEWRLQLREQPARRAQQTLWDGSSLEGRTVLIECEQGLGDTIQFIRYAAVVGAQAGRVVVEAPARMLALLRRVPGIDQLVARGDPTPEFDVHVPLLSLPGILGTRLDTVPADVPYLSADPQLSEPWRRELAGLDGYRVGIAWQGDPKFPDDRFRSVPLACFAPVAEIDGVRLVSLQKGFGTEQIASFAARWPIVDLGPRLDEEGSSFTDTAAVMTTLDLIVTSDSALAHLAGALGAAVWMATPAVPEWRWLLEREDSPWYPTMRLFRQKRRGDWEPVFSRVAEQLQRRMRDPPPRKA